MVGDGELDELRQPDDADPRMDTMFASARSLVSPLGAQVLDVPGQQSDVGHGGCLELEGG